MTTSAASVPPGAPGSLWLATLDQAIVNRPALTSDLDVDVAIVGAGFTGLFTAYYLAAAVQGIRICVLERRFAGFGASGRNGGWCSALFAASEPRLAAVAGPAAAIAMRRAMQETVDEVGRVAADEGIDCHYRKGGTVSLARTPAQLARATAEVAEARALGVAEADLRLLGATEAAEIAHAAGVLGGTFTPHCAALHPARLATGLAAAVERRGVTIYHDTPVLAIEPRRLLTSAGTVRAETIVIATEAYTAELEGYERELAPVYSLMIATEPLPTAVLAEIGLVDRPTFTDFRNLIIYGQRTGDDRIAFGGRGAPYHFGSAIRPDFDTAEAVHRALRQTLVELFPVLERVEITHRWGGPLGIPRDWFPSVTYDRATGIARAGGYVGDGVATTNLAGRTLAELISGTSGTLTELAWVNHRSPRWEPEPLRYLGINAGLVAMTLADHEEAFTGRPSVIGRAMSGLLGH